MNGKSARCSTLGLVSILALLLASNAFAQTPQIQLVAGQSNQVSFKLALDKSISKCNVEISIPGQPNIQTEVSAPDFEVQFDLPPQQAGTSTLQWSGKLKLRGLRSVNACPGSGSAVLVASNAGQSPPSAQVATSPNPASTTAPNNSPSQSQLFQVANASSNSNWKVVSKSNEREFRFNQSNITGSQDARNVYVLMNDIKDGKQISALTHWSINCIEQTIQRKETIVFSAPNLSGPVDRVETPRFAGAKANPNTLGAYYIAEACGAQQNVVASAPEPSSIKQRNSEYVIFRQSTRPDGTIDFVEAIDLNSATPDRSKKGGMWVNWFVDLREGKPTGNSLESQPKGHVSLESLPKSRVTVNATEQYARIALRGKEIYLDSLSTSGNPSDFKNRLDPSSFPHFSKIATPARARRVLSEWIGSGASADGIYYDVVAFLDLVFYVDGSYAEAESTPFLRNAKVEFSSFISRLSSTLGVSPLEVLGYFGITSTNFAGGWGSKFPNAAASKARDDLYLYYRANLDQYKHQRGLHKGFPHDYTPSQLAGEYFPSQFRKYAARADQIAQIRDQVEVTEKNASDARIKAAQYAASPEGQKKAAQTEASEEVERKQREATFAKEFPYYAVMTCGLNGHINIMPCFSGRVGTEIELKNGTEYGLYKTLHIANGNPGREIREGYVIDLRRSFDIKAQNSDDSLILGLTIYERVSNKILFQKQVARFGVIAIKN